MSVAQLPPVDCAARRDPGMAGGRRRSVLAGAITLLLSAQFCLGATDAPFLREGRAGFVVSHIEYGLTTAEAEAKRLEERRRIGQRVEIEPQAWQT